MHYYTVVSISLLLVITGCPDFVFAAQAGSELGARALIEEGLEAHDSGDVQGDFDEFALALAVLAGFRFSEEGEKQEDAEHFSFVVVGMVEVAQSPVEPGLESTFAWRHAIRYLLPMLQDDLLEAFSYQVGVTAGLDGAKDWLNTHPDEASRLRAWIRDRNG